MRREDLARASLKANGLRATSQRVTLLCALLGLAHPATAEELATSSEGAFDLATGYRALQEFERAGLVRRVQLKGVSVYEAVGAHHHHLICRSCGAIEDVDVCLPASVRSKLLAASKRFAMVEDDALEFFGICKSCTK